MQNLKSLSEQKILNLSTTLLVLTLVFLYRPYSVQSQNVYNFNNLTLNYQINNQDNWVDQLGQGTAAIYRDQTPENGTRVVKPVPTVIFNQSAFITRENNTAYSFAQFSGNESNAILQFEVTGDAVGLFALGFDVNNDGKLSPDSGEVGPAFGTWNQNFALQQVKDSALLVPFTSGNSRSDWYRMQLHVNFTANGGSGSGSLYYLNISDSDLTYTPVTGLQNINLKLHNLDSLASPNKWNTMWIQLLATGGNEPAVDNLLPTNLITSVNEINGSDECLKSSISPNPFNETATLHYSLSRAEYVSIIVYNFFGSKVAELVQEFQSEGSYEFAFQSSEWDSGIYFFRINTSCGNFTHKIIKK